MTTISSVLPSGYGNSATAASAGSSVRNKPNAGGAQLASSAPVASSYATFGGNSPLPLTYNAAGLLNAFQQATSAKPSAGKAGLQAAQQAVFAAKNAITETLNSLSSGSSPNNSSTSDNSALFSLPGISSATNPFGLAQGSLSKSATNASTAGSSSAQAAQQAVFAAENAVTETLNSLLSGSSPNSGI